MRAGALAAGLGLPVALLAVAVRARVPAVVRPDDAAVRAGTDLTRSSPGLRAVLVGWQEALQPVWVNAAVVAGCGWAARRISLRPRARRTALTVLVGWGMEALVKQVVRRARPVVEVAVAHASGFSFPSGHVANTTTVGVTVTAAVWPVLGPRARVAVPVAVGAVVVLTGLDRVLLGVHHPSDVAAGALLGGAVAGVSALAAGPRPADPGVTFAGAAP
jgi:membrane-associated phospholipid phosphatase